IADLPWSRLYSFAKSFDYEYGFIVFNKLLSLLFTDQQIYIVVMSLLSLAPVLAVLYHESDYPFDSLVIYLGIPVVLICFSAIRQALAVSVCTVAFLFVRRKRLLPFLLLVLLAMQFHRTAFIFSAAYPLYHVRLDKRLQTVSILLIPLVYLVRVPVFNYFGRLFRPDAVMEDTGSYTLFLIFFMIYVFTVFFGDEDDAREGGYRTLFLMVCLFQAFACISNIAMRVGYYYMPYLPLLLTRLLRVFPEGKERLMVRTAIILSFAVFGYYTFYISRDTWVQASPYLFFWQSAGGI
ncbi:MAG: EpsG family protein, partial [Clostridia bacterium]|nr:EpsG family protein [Clostridia bacterium]